MQLILDFSFRRLAAVAENMGEGRERVLAVSCTDEKGSPLEQVEEVIRKAGVKRSEIDSIIVGLGPGSYTGMRSSLAVAQGWSLGRPVAVTGVEGSLALAMQAWLGGVRGLTRILIDAQRGDVYAADFAISDAGVEPREALRIVPAIEAAQAVDSVIGPEVLRWAPGGRTVELTAEAILEAARNLPPAASPELLEPVYLRPVAFVKSPAASIPQTQVRTG